MTGSEPRTVSFLGPEGSFTHEAALRHFGPSASLRPVASIPAVFEAVQRGDTQRGVVPIENSIEGGVTFTLDLLLQTGVPIVGEALIEIEQCLLTEAERLTGIREVLSHPQGLAQCRAWLHRHLPDASLTPCASTARAALQVRGNPNQAAIASRLAAAVAGVPLLRAGIEDRPSNATRFAVLGDEAAAPSGRDRTSVMFCTAHERGALCGALRVFDQAGINLLRIESRPWGNENWRYAFLVDFEGHHLEAAVSAALRQLERTADHVQLLGSYPRAAGSADAAHKP